MRSSRVGASIATPKQQTMTETKYRIGPRETGPRRDCGWETTAVLMAEECGLRQGGNQVGLRARQTRGSGKFGRSLDGIVHGELDRVRSVLEIVHLLPLQLHVAVDEVVGEHAAGLQEGAIGVEGLESLAQAAADLRNILQFLRRQFVQV